MLIFKEVIAYKKMEKMAHSQKPRDTCLIICHKEVLPTVLSRTRITDHLLVSQQLHVIYICLQHISH